MSLGERILGALSRDPSAVAPDVQGEYLEAPLALLEQEYEGFAGRVRGKAVLDFGCGAGQQSVALAELGAAGVLGIEADPDGLAAARTRAREAGLEDRVRFAACLGPDEREAFDLVISQNAMEHFADPAAVLADLRSAARRPGGRLLITFGPPWFAPYGAHLHYFTKVPWVQLLFRERTVMRVRSRYRSDGAERYEDMQHGLNKMSLRKFERLVREASLDVVERRYACVKGIDGLARVPGLRELLVTHVTCELAPR